MGLTLNRTLLLAAGIAAGVVPMVASAQQTPKRNETVTERYRPDYSPLGIRAGAFLILPKLDLSESHDDNIYATDSSTTGDFITTIKPEVQARSQWSEHALDFKAGGDIERYASESSENNDNYNVSGNGRIDITRNSYIDGGVSYRQLHESRTSPDDAGGRTLTKYTVFSPDAGFFNRWNRVSLKVDGGAQHYNFSDVTTSSGTLVDNTDRDRTRYRGAARLGYELFPQYEAFLRGEYNNINYSKSVDSAGVNRDSHGYETTAGVRIDVTNVLFGDLFGGYRSQNYDDAALETIDGPTWGGALTWNPTRLTTVKASIVRDVIETTQVAASGYFSTAYTASVDHELLRNVILSAITSYTVNQYKGNGRDDDTLQAGVSARYLMRRNLYLSAGYSYEDRESNVVNADYKKNVFMLRLAVQY